MVSPITLGLFLNNYATVAHAQRKNHAVEDHVTHRDERVEHILSKSKLSAYFHILH